MPLTAFTAGAISAGPVFVRIAVSLTLGRNRVVGRQPPGVTGIMLAMDPEKAARLIVAWRQKGRKLQSSH